jgi:hypothetical protein
MQIESVNHVESAGVAQEKQAHSDELELHWKLQICEVQIWTHLTWPFSLDILWTVLDNPYFLFNKLMWQTFRWVQFCIVFKYWT